MQRQIRTDARYLAIGCIDTAVASRRSAKDARAHMVGCDAVQSGTMRSAPMPAFDHENLPASLAGNNLAGAQQ